MINAMTVKGFGESEFWFSMVKVIAIVAFIIIGFFSSLERESGNHCYTNHGL
jgi:amino acid permease